MLRIMTLIFCILGSGTAFASENRADFPQTSSKAYTLEPAYTISSIGGGSQFISVNLSARLASWFRMGLGADLPATFEEESQIFMARLFGRIQLLGGQDKVYIQGAVMTGFLSRNTYGNEMFSGLEGLIGYSRAINRSWELGARLGAQISGYNQYNNDSLYTGTPRFFSRMSFVATYNF